MVTVSNTPILTLTDSLRNPNNESGTVKVIPLWVG